MLDSTIRYYTTPTEATLAMAGNARTALEHYEHEHRVLSGQLESFLCNADRQDIYEFLCAYDTYHTHIEGEPDPCLTRIP